MSDNKPRLVVLGGSFNPPTKAHKLILEAAMAHLDAETGVYVPSSKTYVTRKVTKNRNVPAGILSEETRLRMLGDMCDEHTCVDTCEFGDTSRGRTLKTLQHIQEKWPDHEIWFIMGIDKMQAFARWPDRTRILSEFRILWADRNNHTKTSWLDRIRNDISYNAHKDFCLYSAHQDSMDKPAGTYGLSSSLFWQKLSAGDESCFDILDDRIPKDKKRDYILKERE